ncbi:MAG TPA: DegT/DnrJ/EryC1/StrS family aminotransferase [Candidatus Acidoferrales bacterium]
MKIPLSSPDINDQDRAAVLEALDSGILSLGPRLVEFEQAVTKLTGSRYAVAVNSGTSALHLCVKAANIKDGDEIITTPFSFVASANCILFERAKPVFVDVDPVTLNIDVSKIEDAITPKTKAILPVHVFGRPCALTDITYIAKRHGLKIIEDSCEAIGAKHQDKPVGTFGETGVFAFYPNKQLTTGEGGVIVTDDPQIASRCRSWRNQGRSDADGWLEHDSLGYNYRLSEMNCALGISQLSRIDEILAARARVAGFYDNAFEDCFDVIPPRLSEPGSTVSWFVYVVQLGDDFDRDDRDSVIATLKQQGIGCRNYFPPIHLQPLYQNMFGFGPGDFPVAEHAAERTIALPFFNRLSEEEVRFVCQSLANAMRTLGSASAATEVRSLSAKV